MLDIFPNHRWCQGILSHRSMMEYVVTPKLERTEPFWITALRTSAFLNSSSGSTSRACLWVAWLAPSKAREKGGHFQQVRKMLRTWAECHVTLPQFSTLVTWFVRESWSLFPKVQHDYILCCKNHLKADLSDEMLRKYVIAAGFTRKLESSSLKHSHGAPRLEELVVCWGAVYQNWECLWQWSLRFQWWADLLSTGLSHLTIASGVSGQERCSWIRRVWPRKPDNQRMFSFLRHCMICINIAPISN